MLSLVRAVVRTPCWRPATASLVSPFSTSTRLQARQGALHVSHLPETSLKWSRISIRRYQHLAPEPPKKPAASASKSPVPTPTPSGKVPGGDPENPTQSEQRRKDWRIIWKLLENVWPKNDWNTRGRVMFGLALLIGGKVGQ